MASASIASGSIDDLFRHKSLNEIRNILDQTTDEVEGKKRELRELVGDHYRNVLESADTIRAMSECVSKVSVGAIRVEELIASMRQLATNAPCALDPTPLRTAAAKARMVAGQDNEYQLAERIMHLLEVPETVRGHLTSCEYALAARSALLDTVALQNEVSELLQGGSEGISLHNAFDFKALLQQQATTLRRLPRQIAASCLDAFSAVSLEPSSAAQSFVVHLLLDPSLPPPDLLRRFLERRRQLLQRLLDNSVDGSSANCGTRLASAAMAYEGTVVIAAALCQGSAGSEPPRLKKALMDMLEGLPQDGDTSFRRRVDSLGALLRHSNTGARTMCGDLGQLGQAMAEEWAGSNSKPSLASRFARLAASQASTATLSAVGSKPSVRSCEALGCALKQCCEKVLSYRHTLGGACASESWPVSWTSACQRFCPGCAPPRDALGCVTDAVEAACAAVVRERVEELKLDLVFVAEDEELVGDSPGTEDETTTISDAQRREEMRAIQEQSHLRVEHFNEQLAEILLI